MASVQPPGGWAVNGPINFSSALPATYPLTASATITGGQMLAVSGPGTVAPAGASSTAVIGYAVDDCANGAVCNVLLLGGPVVTATASGSITAGAQCIAAAAGAVATIGAATFEKIIGVALDSPTTGQPFRLALRS